MTFFQFHEPATLVLYAGGHEAKRSDEKRKSNIKDLMLGCSSSGRKCQAARPDTMRSHFRELTTLFFFLQRHSQLRADMPGGLLLFLSIRQPMSAYAAHAHARLVVFLSLCRACKARPCSRDAGALGKQERSKKFFIIFNLYFLILEVDPPRTPFMAALTQVQATPSRETPFKDLTL